MMLLQNLAKVVGLVVFCFFSYSTVHSSQTPSQFQLHKCRASLLTQSKIESQASGLVCVINIRQGLSDHLKLERVTDVKAYYERLLHRLVSENRIPVNGFALDVLAKMLECELSNSIHPIGVTGKSIKQDGIVDLDRIEIVPKLEAPDLVADGQSRRVGIVVIKSTVKPYLPKRTQMLIFVSHAKGIYFLDPLKPRKPLPGQLQFYVPSEGLEVNLPSDYGNWQHHFIEGFIELTSQ